MTLIPEHPISEQVDDAGSHPRLPDALTEEMTRLFSSGYSLIPLGGEDGKKSVMYFKDRKRLPLKTVIDRMAAAGSHSYGVRLKGIMVVDVDADTPQARKWIEQNIGRSPFMTRTSRGFHLWFRHNGLKPKNIAAPGIAIDFKLGENQYVVGPNSVRPDGVRYLAATPLVERRLLPEFRYQEATSSTEPIATGTFGTLHPKGTRREAIKKFGFGLARTCGSFDELRCQMFAFRDQEVEQPEDFSDDDVASLAGWFWQKRESGELWGGHSSCIPVRRSVSAMLLERGEHDALALYVDLLGCHGHVTGRTFSVVPDGLKKSGRLKSGRGKIYDAIRILEEIGAIICVRKSAGKGSPKLFRFGSGSREVRQEERPILTLVSSEDTNLSTPGQPKDAA